MAVVDKYTDSKIVGNSVDKLLTAANSASADLFNAIFTFEVAAGDDDGSVYRIIKNISPNLIPVRFEIYSDSITNGTDWDLGLYNPNLGAVIIKDVFMNGQTFATANALGTPFGGLAAVDIANINKRIFEHAGHTISTKLEAYDLAFTANTVGTVAGTVSGVLTFAQG